MHSWTFNTPDINVLLRKEDRLLGGGYTEELFLVPRPWIILKPWWTQTRAGEKKEFTSNKAGTFRFDKYVFASTDDILPLLQRMNWTFSECILPIN